MKTQAEIAAEEKRRGSLVGSLFAAPVLIALTILAVWVAVAIMLTPGAGVEGYYGEMARELRRSLIFAGIGYDAAGLLIVLYRLTKPFDAG